MAAAKGRGDQTAMRTLRIAMAQMNPTVGDLSGNVRCIATWLREAKKANVDLIVFPELALTGSSPEDLLLSPKFLLDSQRALKEVVRACRGVVAVVGCVEQGSQGLSPTSRVTASVNDRYPLYNAAAFIADGYLVGTSRKWYVKNDGVADECRYFQPGRTVPLLVVQGIEIGVTIGDDVWIPEGPIRSYAAARAEVVVHIHASPFHVGKHPVFEQALGGKAREVRATVVSTNMVGGQDELVFDGYSLIVDPNGHTLMRGHLFKEELIVADVVVGPMARKPMSLRGTMPVRGHKVPLVERVKIATSAVQKKSSLVSPPMAEPVNEIAAVYDALVFALQEYLRKNGLKRVVLGLSGGVDSAITAALAVDALGTSAVLGVFMPSPYTSRESEEDVAELARRLGIGLTVIPINPMVDAYQQALASSFAGQPTDATEENLQARVRGNLLMAISNKFGHLVLITGNKSEFSVGYSTLYGDMAGGFAVIKDVPKTMVYDLARYCNGKGSVPVIPERILDRPPTAELRPNQKDEDTLPPYAILDPILRAYVEEDRSFKEIVQAGFDRSTVARVLQMVDRSEFKRRQAPIGVKVSGRAFGKDRRMPLTNGYRSVPE